MCVVQSFWTIGIAAVYSYICSYCNLKYEGKGIHCRRAVYLVYGCAGLIFIFIFLIQFIAQITEISRKFTLPKTIGCHGAK